MYKVFFTFPWNQVCVCLIVFNHVNEAFVCYLLFYLLSFNHVISFTAAFWNKVFYPYFRVFCRFKKLINLIIIKISYFGVFYVIFVTGNCRFSNNQSNNRKASPPHHHTQKRKWQTKTYSKEQNDRLTNMNTASFFLSSIQMGWR